MRIISSIFLPKVFQKYSYILIIIRLDIDWHKVGIGIALSMGQVWAVKNLIASSIINFAVFLHSPLLFVMATIGATIGTLIGVAFLPADSLWEGDKTKEKIALLEPSYLTNLLCIVQEMITLSSMFY